VRDQGTPLPPGTVTASAVVAPAQTTRLSFVIGGIVKELAVREGDTVQAGQLLAALNAPELEYGVMQAEAAAQAAEFKYQYWIPPRFDRPPERRQLAEQEFIKVQKSADTARAEATRATLSAPFAGTVTSLETAPGELVQPGEVVMTLAGLDHLRIETTDLSERDVARVKTGQNASVSVEALDGTLTGRVIAISPIADTVGGDVVYKVTIELDSSPEGLRWGMTAEVSIATQ
jgi:HlyD family secretion protein